MVTVNDSDSGVTGLSILIQLKPLSSRWSVGGTRRALQTGLTLVFLDTPGPPRRKVSLLFSYEEVVIVDLYLIHQPGSGERHLASSEFGETDSVIGC